MAKVEIEIGANPRPFESALDSMRKRAGDFAGHLQGLGSKIAAGVASAAIFQKTVEKIGDAVEQYKQFNDQIERGKVLLGGTGEEWQRIAHAANLAEVETADLEKALLRMRGLSADAMKGDPDARGTFANLEIDPEKFGMAPLTEQTLMLADAFTELSKRGDPVNLFMESLGAKNRSLILLLKQGREEIAKTMQAAPVISDDAHDAEMIADDARKTRAARKRAAVAESGAVETKDAVDRIWEKTAEGTMDFLGGVHDLAIETANFLGTNTEGERTRDERRQDRERAAILHAFGIKPGDVVPDFAPRGDPSDEPRTPPEKPPATPKAPLALPVFAPSEAAAMNEQQRQMDERNRMLLVDSASERAEALKGEQLRILTSATQESDPKKAFSLLMKGKGMESEIVSAIKAMDAPENLVVKSGRGAEMGLGGPSVSFGGVEMQLRQQTDYLRIIAAKVSGNAGSFVMSTGGTAPDGSQNPAGVFPLATITPNFPKER